MRVPALSMVFTALLVGACSGATSSELFDGAPVGVPESEAEATDPDFGPDAAAQDDESSAHDAASDTWSRRDAASDADTAPDAQARDDAGTPSADASTATACTRDLECPTKLLCNSVLGECSPRLPKGGPCRRNTECSSGGCRLSTMTCG